MVVDSCWMADSTLCFGLRRLSLEPKGRLFEVKALCGNFT